MPRLKIDPVRSIGELHRRALVNTDYLALAFRAAENLGGRPKKLDEAIRWLRVNALETNEQGVVDEINFCR